MKRCVITGETFVFASCFVTQSGQNRVIREESTIRRRSVAANSSTLQRNNEAELLIIQEMIIFLLLRIPKLLIPFYISHVVFFFLSVYSCI